MSNLGQAALIVVGTVVGAYFGDPALGFALGGLVGSALFPTQLPDGPKLTDNRTTTANLGEPVPIVFGTAVVSGTVIFLAPSVQSSSESGGKGGPEQKLYSYNQTIAIALCESPIDGGQAIGGLTRIWENGTLVYDIRPQLAADTALGTVAETDAQFANRQTASTAYAAKFTLYLGDENQLPDPTIEETQGYGNVPAFRGLAYVVFPNRLLENAQGLRHPNFSFEVYQSGTGDCTTQTQYSNDVLYPWLVNSADPTNPNNSNVFHISAVDPAASTYLNPGNLNQYSTLADALAVADASQGISMDAPILYHTWSAQGGGQDQTMRGGNAPGPNIITHGAGDMSFVEVDYSFSEPGSTGYYSATMGLPASMPNGEFYYAGSTCIPLGAHTSDTAPLLPSPYLHLTIGNPYGSTPYWYGFRYNTTIRITRTPAAPLNPWAGLLDWPQNTDYCVELDGTIIKKAQWAQVTGNFFVLGTFTNSADTNTPCLYPANPCIPYFSPDAFNESFWTTAYENAVAAGTLPAGYTYAPGAGGGETESKTYPQLQNYAWQLDRVVCQGLGGVVSVADIIKACCTRAGIPLSMIDVTDMESQTIDGYQISSLSSAAAIIAPTRSLAFWDAVESGNVLRFQSRGKAIAATLTVDDIGAYDAQAGSDTNVPPSLSIVRSMDTDLPRQIRLHYLAKARDYQDGEQDSPFRLTTVAVNDQDVSIPMVIGDTQALQAADILWQNAWNQRTQYTLSVDQAWAHLEVGDAIAIPVDGYYERVMIVSAQDASGILRKFTCVSDDEDSYVSTRIAPPSIFQPPRLLLLAATQFELLDLPALQDADSDPGFYVAAQRDPSTGDQWKGCTFYKSIDGGSTYTALFSITGETTLGTVAAVVPESQAYTWDDVTKITVNVATDAFTFQSRTDDAVIAGANAAAMGADGRWEIVQFANATQVNSTQWTLSRLLRGRRGTEHVMGSSVAGDRFVMLVSGSLQRVVLQTSEIGADRDYVATSIGQSFSSGNPTVFAGHAQALLPFSPIDATGAYQVNGDILITWVRRDRLGRTLMSGVATPMSETVEAYSVDIMESAAVSSPLDVVRTVAVGSSKALTYTAAQQAADFPGGPLASLTVRVYQLSSVIGRGTPAVATIELDTSSDTISDNIVTHESTVTFGGTFLSSENITVMATYTPHTGAPTLYRWTLAGSGKSAVVDYATDLTTQAGAALAGKCVVTRAGDLVTMTTTSGSITCTYLTNSPIATVTTFRDAVPVQSAINNVEYLDLWTPTGILSPTNDSSYNVSGDATYQFTINAYDPLIETALSDSVQPAIPSGLEAGHVTTGGITLGVTYSLTPGGTSYLNAIYNLAAAMNASTALRPYLAGATAGMATSTPDGAMSRSAIFWTMKPGYTMGFLTTQTNPTGWIPKVNTLTNGRPGYSSGAAKIVAVQLNDAYDYVSGTYFSTLAIGQVYRIVLNGTTFSHEVDSADMNQPEPGSFDAGEYYRDNIYEDLADQITTAGGFTVQLSKYYQEPGGPDTWIYQIVITSTTPGTDFTCTASVDFDLTVAIANT